MGEKFLAFLSGLMLVGVGVLMLIATSKDSHVPVSRGTDTTVLPSELVATPERYWVNAMKEGISGWVGYGAIYVDADSHMWIAPDWTVVKQKGPFDGDSVYIQREGEYIILYRDSLGPYKWTPGVDSGWNVDKKPGLIPVKLR